MFCIKYLDENNNILGVDTADLTFGCVQNLGNSSSNWAVQDPQFQQVPAIFKINIWEIICHIEGILDANNTTRTKLNFLYQEGKLSWVIMVNWIRKELDNFYGSNNPFGTIGILILKRIRSVFFYLWLDKNQTTIT